MPVCASCNKHLFRCDFSKSQFKKKACQRRCKQCTGAIPKFELQPTKTRLTGWDRCKKCHLWKEEDDFSRSQRVHRKKNDRHCLQCAMKLESRRKCGKKRRHPQIRKRTSTNASNPPSSTSDMITMAQIEQDSDVSEIYESNSDSDIEVEFSSEPEGSCKIRDNSLKMQITTKTNIRDLYTVSPREFLTSYVEIYVAEDGDCWLYSMLTVFGLCQHSNRRKVARSIPSDRDKFLCQSIRDYLSQIYGRKSSVSARYSDEGLLIQPGEFGGDGDDLETLSLAFDVCIVYWNEYEDWAYDKPLHSIPVFIEGLWKMKYASQLLQMVETGGKCVNLLFCRDYDPAHLTVYIPRNISMRFLVPPPWLQKFAEEFD